MLVILVAVSVESVVTRNTLIIYTNYVYSEIIISFNNIGILPNWIYRQERFSRLEISGNNLLVLTSHQKSQINPADFVTANVPSLFALASKYIITKRYALRRKFSFMVYI